MSIFSVFGLSYGSVTPVAGLIFETKNRAVFLERFFWRGISGAALLPVQLCSHQCLWSGFIFPELEHLYKNVFMSSFPKRSVRNLGCSFVSKTTGVTPVAGLIFETKNRAIFLERFFERGITAREQVSRAVILARFEVIQ